MINGINQISASLPVFIRSGQPVQGSNDPIEVDASYIPAEMSIQSRNPEMSANWDPIWEQLGLPSISTAARELHAKAQQTVQQGIMETARNGDRIRDIHQREKNVYGKLAYEKYMRTGQRDVQLEALPKSTVHFDVTIHPLEITVNVHVKGLKSQL